MPILQVRDLPQHIYDALREQAKVERRSLAQQAVIVLERGLDVQEAHKARRRAALAAIRSSDHTPYQALPDAAKLIREDRNR
jgi:uncharacterized protein involved in propanediol utilization